MRGLRNSPTVDTPQSPTNRAILQDTQYPGT